MVPIFYYHSVGSQPPQTLAADVFRAHLEAIRRHDFTPVTVAQLLRGEAPERACVLSFDDGLLDNFTVVFPLLAEFGYRATFYVVPGYDHVTRWVNPADGRWSDTPKEGFTQAFSSMGKEHRRQLLSAGMEIGCHTFTHRKLTKIPKGELRSEILGARRHLEEELGCPVESFCFPNGRFNCRVLAEVKRAGFQGACSTIPGYYSSRGPRFILPRFLVEDPVIFEYLLRGRALQPRQLWRLLSKRLFG